MLGLTRGNAGKQLVVTPSEANVREVLTAEEVRAAIARVPRWRHAIELAQGVVTPGYPTQRKLRLLGLPADLTGKTVLDVGCSDGFFAFECEKRGASRVVAFDEWSSPYVDSPAGFRLAHKVLGSKVEHYNLDLLALDATELGQFDVVLCLGVLYHLRHPLLAMEQLARLTKEVLYLETGVSESILNQPVMHFVEGLYHGRDITTWWIPSISCVQQMARSAGFQHVEIAKIYDTRAVFRCYKDSDLLRREILAYRPEEIAALAGAPAADSRQQALLEMSWEELRNLQQRLLMNRMLPLGESRRAVPIFYGGYRRILASILDVLRALKLRYR